MRRLIKLIKAPEPFDSVFLKFLILLLILIILRLSNNYFSVHPLYILNHFVYLHYIITNARQYIIILTQRNLINNPQHNTMLKTQIIPIISIININGIKWQHQEKN